MGDRTGIPQTLLDLCKERDYVLVSIDYRLAPEVKLPAIIADVKDALAWVKEKGPKLFHANPERIVVAGGSAGGDLPLVTRNCVWPAPRALCAQCGYGGVVRAR